ncbi:hypothetical protein HOP62_10475 [Halomonas sp. MCCC 1A17488]|uniref:Uncharacterized protein n=1 Tax=Billgrantia sulfidoxydans TaxID=2733484 RepID=A0ABX7W4G9_9GAMM|nr:MULTISPECIES: hypothetical protein [Halomonas]MCE8016493.1 hypothetical protein [Halomonas sp. MCCC 1A17488]MCG3239826.1 hypothetical protein [Halomonas sp. MCCC 1A17488]QPP50274.1 hypothetical protein I4484_03900 [Halomonas sp. SS10-MC5]QTP53893.1 hypothetical protein HNO51_03855 [Halomonas sulfidoxydans]
MGIIEMLTVSVAAVALLALAYAASEKQRHPIRKEVRIEEHERDSYRNRSRHD